VKEDRILHVISFNIPYPPDYGGVIDVYYKLKALHQAGVRIILHNFQYGREISEKLNEICDAVYYYQRKSSTDYFFRRTPYIVSTRDSQDLLQRLQKDNFPILFEGIHTSFFIPELEENKRKLIIRAHNIEHRYYSQLAKNEKKLWRKVFFYIESIKLSAYEKHIYSKNSIAAISQNDQDYFSETYGNSTLVNAFHPYRDVKIQTGSGSYILYHGNLSVPENIEAAIFLLKEIFPSIPYPCIIAGKHPDKSILKLAEGLNNVKILGSPGELLMQELISGAQVNILPAFQDSGMKLKLLAALFSGKHCLVNSMMVSDSGLDPLCEHAESVEDMISKTIELIATPFSEFEAEKRRSFLNVHYNNSISAERLIQLIWPY
jgi:hypothetical protein